MESTIIKKWIEPYKLLETIKEYYTCTDFTFDGITKNIEKKKFLKNLESNKNTVGLYMKNVNKYYLFQTNKNIDIWEILLKEFNFKQEDFEKTKDVDLPFNLIDIGKAEASLIFREL